MSSLEAARGAVCWVEVQDKVGWWPAQVLSVPPRVPEGRLRVRLFGKGEEKEIEADSESMSFEEPGVGQNLQKAPAGDFISKAAHAQFKSAVAEAQRCSKEGGALSEESEDDAAEEPEEAAEAQPQGRTTRKRKEAAPTMSVEGLPDGWVCSTHVTPSGQQYKRYKGPGGGRAQSLKQVWVLHDKAAAKGSVASSARASDEQEAAAAKGGEGMPDGWVCSTHVAPSGQQYKRYKGPNGERAQSLKQVWVLHDADPTSSAECGETSPPVDASAAGLPAAPSSAAAAAAAAAAALAAAPEEGMVAPGQQSLTLEIKIPPGHPPGSKLTCRGPNGVAYTMIVPPDSAEGSKVRFKVAAMGTDGLPLMAAGPPVLAARHCAPFGGAEPGVPISLEQLEASQAALRLHGNAAFKEGRHHDALAHYSEVRAALVGGR